MSIENIGIYCWLLNFALISVINVVGLILGASTGLLVIISLLITMAFIFTESKVVDWLTKYLLKKNLKRRK